MRYVAPYGVTDPNQGYVNGNPATGVAGSIPPAEAFEGHLRELSTLITKAGITPSAADLEQVLRSVRRQSLNYAVDTGSANALSVAYDPVFDVLTPGLPLRVKAAYSNTGAATITVDAFGPVPIKRCNGAVLDADDITAGSVVDMVYDGTNFQLTNFRGFTADIENTNNYFIKIPYIADSNAGVNAVTATFSPPITTVAAGDLIEVLIDGTNTAAVTIVVNALPSKSIKTVDGYDLQAGQLVDGMVALLVYDGTVWQLVNPAIPRTGAGGSGVQIAKRLTWQDPNYHVTTGGEGNFLEAFRVTYAPVTPNNKLWIQINGNGGSGTGAQDAGKRNWYIYMAYSVNGGSTWNPPSYPGWDYPSVGSFMANVSVSTWENPNSICSEREESYVLSGELTIPAGPPASILVRVMIAVGAANCPDAILHGGSMVQMIEYTPGP